MKWTPRDLMAGFLTFVIGVFIMSVAVAPFFTDRAVSDAKAQMIAMIIGSVVTILTGYIVDKRSETKLDKTK